MIKRTYNTDLFEMMKNYGLKTTEDLLAYTNAYPHAMDVSQQKSILDRFRSGSDTIERQPDGSLLIKHGDDNQYIYVVAADGKSCKRKFMDVIKTETECTVETFGNELQALIIEDSVHLVWPVACVEG